MKKRDWKNIESRRLIQLVTATGQGCVTTDMVEHFTGRSFNSLQSQWNRIKGKTFADFPIDPLQQQAEEKRESLLDQYRRKTSQHLLPAIGSLTLTGKSEIVNYLRSHGLRGTVTIDLGE